VWLRTNGTYFTAGRSGDEDTPTGFALISQAYDTRAEETTRRDPNILAKIDQRDFDGQAAAQQPRVYSDMLKSMAATLPIV